MTPKLDLRIWTPRTYIYLKDDGCVHQQAAGTVFGKEYYHDDPTWQPPTDWPYEIIDLRKKRSE